MANGSNLLDEVGQGLGKVLPYALPAAMGAALGGIPGALMGAASTVPTQQDYLAAQQQQLEGVKTGLELQKAQIQEAQLASMKALGEDPHFKAFMGQHIGISPDHMADFLNLPPDELKAILDSATKLAVAGGPQGLAFKGPDGQYYQNDKMGNPHLLGGTPSNVEAAKVAQEAAQKRTETTTASGDEKARMTRIETASKDFITGWKPPGVFDVGDKRAANWWESYRKSLITAGATEEEASSKATAQLGKLPQGVLPSRAPRELWGKPGRPNVGILKGVKVSIDSMGNVKPL